MKNHKECFFCKGVYSYCPSCWDDRNKPGWMWMFDKEKCKDAFNILSEHSVGNITDNEAKEKLIAIGVTSDDAYSEETKKHINQIMGTPNKFKSEESQIINDVTNDEAVDEYKSLDKKKKFMKYKK